MGCVEYVVKRHESQSTWSGAGGIQQMKRRVPVAPRLSSSWSGYAALACLIIGLFMTCNGVTTIVVILSLACVVAAYFMGESDISMLTIAAGACVSAIVAILSLVMDRRDYFSTKADVSVSGGASWMSEVSVVAVVVSQADGLAFLLLCIFILMGILVPVRHVRQFTSWVVRVSLWASTLDVEHVRAGSGSLYRRDPTSSGSGGSRMGLVRYRTVPYAQPHSRALLGALIVWVMHGAARECAEAGPRW